MTNDTLHSSIPSQRQTETSTDAHPSVLMDDPVYLMDDPGAFMGNQTVNSDDIPVSHIDKQPGPSIHSPSF
jgi:hypothetical protein